MSKRSRVYDGSRRGTKRASCAVTGVSRSNAGVYRPLKLSRPHGLSFFTDLPHNKPSWVEWKFFAVTNGRNPAKTNRGYSMNSDYIAICYSLQTWSNGHSKIYELWLLFISILRRKFLIKKILIEFCMKNITESISNSTLDKIKWTHGHPSFWCWEIDVLWNIHSLICDD